MSTKTSGNYHYFPPIGYIELNRFPFSTIFEDLSCIFEKFLVAADCKLSLDTKNTMKSIIDDSPL